MKGYTNKISIENYTLTTIADTFDSQLNEWIEAAETYIDRFTGRNFIADTEASERLYDGNGQRELLIDDFIELSSIELDGEALTTDDYYLYPANGARKYKIKLAARFTKGDQNVAVTAKWGYSVAIPADVKLAATILVAGIMNFANKTRTVRSQSIGAYSVTYSSDKGWGDFKQAMKTLKSYRKITF